MSLNSGIGGATPVSSTSVDTSSGDSGTAAATPPWSVATAGVELGARAAQYALGEQGVPYVWGGSGPGGFDCSGLVVWAYARRATAACRTTPASLERRRPRRLGATCAPGDLVFFHGLSHVGIYIGGGQFVHAPHTGDVVKVSSLSDPWYSSGFDGGVRITGLTSTSSRG